MKKTAMGVSSHPWESDHDYESGYVSGSSSEASIPDLYFTKPHLAFLNRQLQQLEPSGTSPPTVFSLPVPDTKTTRPEILQWCTTTLPSLFQETAFGLTGLTTLDMLSKLNKPRSSTVDLLFFDTLHHFRETLDLIDRIRQRYPLLNLHIYKPAGVDNAEEFAQRYGQSLWETNDQLYDWYAKVEPAERAYRELGVNAVLTGRRRTQGGKRGDISVIEVDEAGLVKVNPFANWTFEQIENYIKTNDVPYNPLLDRGYKSVGDWHSTQPVKADESERAGRWQGQEKSECGIHNPRSNFAQYLRKQELKQQQQQSLQQALESGLDIES